MSEYKNLIVEQKDAVLIVKINREKALNALNKGIITELQQLFSHYWSDDTVSCVIVSGAGEKAFVAGADIPELADLDVRGGTELAARGQYLMKTIQNFPSETAYNPDPLPQVGETTDDFLKLGHTAENEAILLYRKIIEEAIKRGDTTTRRIFEDIVMQEEEHYWKFDDFLI